MIASSIDLSALQADRDAEIRVGRAIVAARIDALADLILRWASRADMARVRLVTDDSEASYAVSRWALRRLRGDVRRLVGKNLPDSVRLDALGLAEAAYLDRLRALETGNDSEVSK
ncbi:MAG: hypothetical protein ACRYGP_30210 [Janthinobacterium lividum]